MKRVELIPYNTFLMLQAIEILVHKFHTALVHHRQHVWEFLRVLEVLAFDCFEGALGRVVVWTDSVEGSSLLTFDVAAEVLVAHQGSRLLSI